MESHMSIPPYAILSHTWEDEEVTLQDWNSPARDGMKGFQKILRTCQLAASDGIKYAWVDTCCIDKSNSAELSEAINSMYRWYREAKVCFAYLSDLHIYSSAPESTPGPKMISLLRKCRWFARGWTLQELIAPADVRFYQYDWRYAGTKSMWNKVLSDVTGISYNALSQYKPKDYSIAERMSWAARRETTREEDVAYCLLGIFDVNMPLIYGEGAKAFRRLQEEIIRTGYDVSIFAWTRAAWDLRNFSLGVFADAPGDFRSIPRRVIELRWKEVSLTNTGIKLNLELCLVRTPQTGKLSYVLPISTGDWMPAEWLPMGKKIPALGVELKKISPGIFMRRNTERLVEMPEHGEEGIVTRIRCPNAYIVMAYPPGISSCSWGNSWGSYEPFFTFSQGCRVINSWPSGSWDDETSKLMAVASNPNYGSLLVEVQDPPPVDDCPSTSGQTVEFMFLFNILPVSGKTTIKRFPWDMKYTIVGYREHQLMLDIINLRMGAGDMDVMEMRRTLDNLATPLQRTASIPIEGIDHYIYTSVDFDSKSGFTFTSWSVVLEND